MPRRSEAAVAAVGRRLLRTRVLVRLPIGLYRHGLGALLGGRFLLLEHTGRRSGLPREVVLEVVDRPAPDRAVVIAGFGERSQWFRNVRADPQVRISLARIRSAPAAARILPDDEARHVLATYVARHGRAWGWFRPVVERTLGRRVDLDAAPPMVEFRLEPV